MTKKIWLRAVASIVVLPLLSAEFTSLYAQAERATPQASGYFSPSSLPDFTGVLPPAPKAGDARDLTDRAIFHATRALQGNSRWDLAREDNDLSVSALLRLFSCPLGTKLTVTNAPRLRAFLDRISVDSNKIGGILKSQYQRKRPFIVEDGPICIDRSPNLVNSGDYPSGHASLGWLVGLALADLEPSHARAVLTRARAVGDSRTVCGVHNASAVESGWTLASIVFAALNSMPEFRKDFEAVGAELALLGQSGPTTETQTCAAELSLAAESPYNLTPPAPGPR